MRTVYTGEDDGETKGPWVVHVLSIYPDTFNGKTTPELATGIVPGREKLTSISDRTDSLAAMNGGYFVIDENDGTPGDLAGISVIDGNLVSEAVDGRTSLIPQGRGEGADIAAISDTLTATSSDGATREVDGLNRKPGLIRGCGGDGGDRPTEQPKHDFTCTDRERADPLHLRLRHQHGARPGVETVLDSSGRVIEVRGTPGAGPYPRTVPSSRARVRPPGGCSPTPNQGRRSTSRRTITAGGAPLALGPASSTAARVSSATASPT